MICSATVNIFFLNNYAVFLENKIIVDSSTSLWSKIIIFKKKIIKNYKKNLLRNRNFSWRQSDCRSVLKQFLHVNTIMMSGSFVLCEIICKYIECKSGVIS